MKGRHIAQTFFIIIGLTTAYFLGRHHGQPSTEATSSAPPLPIGRLSPATPPAAGPADSADAALNLAPLGTSLPTDSEELVLTVRGAIAEDDPVTRSLQLARIYAGLTPENAPIIATEFLDPRGRARSLETWMEWKTLMEAWGGLDGPSAAAFALGIEPELQNPMLMEGVMAGWVTGSAAEANRFVAGIENDSQRGWAYRGLVTGLATSDPDKAVEMALAALEAREPKSNNLNYLIASEVYRQQGDAALSWAAGLSDDHNFRSNALSSIISEEADISPPDAAEKLIPYLGEPYAEGAIARIADAWAQEDIGGALTWVAGLPETANTEGAWHNLIAEWSEDDPHAAADYLAAMPASPHRDQGAKGLAERHIHVDPEAALSWAMSISDQEKRGQTVRWAARQWLERDPADALAWLGKSDIPEDWRSKIMK